MKLKTIFVTLAVVCALPVATVANDAAWDGRFGSPGLSGPVYAIKIRGGEIYAGGAFTTAGGVSASRIAKWNNANWSALGSGVSGDVYAIAVSGSDVYVGGAFTTAGGKSANRVAKWNGSSWSALGTGVSGDVRAIAISGNDVYVGGSFTSAGGTAALRIAKWNGSSWSTLGTGVSDDIYAIAVDGNDVYVGGAFTAAGGAGAVRIARWNGSTWSALGSGLSEAVNAITIVNGTVYVGGAFTTAGAMGAARIARWNGSSWSALGSGLSGTVNAVSVDGSDIYVGGEFTTAGGSTASRIAIWNGGSWASLGSGVTDIVHAISASAGDVHIGGEFTVAGAKPSFYFGRYNPAIVAIFITNFRAEIDASGVKLSWDIFADENVAGFRVYRRERGGKLPYVMLATRDPIPPDARTYIDPRVKFGETYEYILGVARPDGSEVRSPPAEVTTATLVLNLDQNYPNPFNPATTIRFTLPEPQLVTLAVVDVQGKNVTTLVNETLEAGVKEFQWDGRDRRGNPVSSGVYFYRLQAGKIVQKRKMVLVK